MSLTIQTFKKSGIAILVLAMLFLAGIVTKPVSAATTNVNTSIESQLVLIQQLLEQIKQLQATLTKMQSTGTTGQGDTCLDIKNNLSYRATDVFSGGEVTALQDFLQSKGYLNYTPTGFFGLMTSDAVKSFQTANGIEVTGSVGPLTRAKIKAHTCTNPGVTPPIACTLDVKVCSDGSSVSRVAPSCNFAACPSASQPVAIPKITSATFSQEGAFLRVYGKNLGTVSKLEYQANCCKPVEGTLSTGTIGKDTYASFNLDTYLGNSEIRSLKVRVVDMYGNASNFEEVEIGDEEEPEITSAELTRELYVGGANYLVVEGRYLEDVVKLEYRTVAVSGVSEVSVSGTLSTILSETETSAKFALDILLGNGVITSLKVRVVDVYGNTSGWVSATISTSEITFDQNLSALPVSPTISGTSNNIEGLGFTLTSMNGDKVWGSGPVAISMTNGWSITIPSSVERGEYNLNVYNDNDLILTVIIDIGLKG